jgi:hypothetical protein
MKEHLKFLGLRVRDLVTGSEGVVVSISFDVSGCVQGLINPGKLADGKLGDSFWVDTKRLRAVADTPVVEQPTFEHIPGGEKLPLYSNKPTA